MATRASASLARIGVLILLVVVATTGGSAGVSVHDASEYEAATLNTPVPTSEAVAMMYPTANSTESSTPTVPPLPPTEVPTTIPAPEPTSEPAERGYFPAPENTSGRSIIIDRGPTDQRMVALTFDAGEGRGYTIEILDLLKQEGIHASFGTTGAWARLNPDLILRIVDEGHLLFNHSESHLSWTGASPGTEPINDEIRTSQVMDAHDAVEDVADYDMRPYWRPPYGDYDAEGQVLLASLGYDYTLFWTCDSLGWNGYSAQEIVEHCGPTSESGGPGAIILFHVAQEQDYLSLEQLIAEYQGEGYEFVTFDKMIAD